MRVGFIGLGHMGGPMSANILAAGHDLVVHDVRTEAAAGLLAAGATWAGSPRETGAGRDVVITMLPAPRQVAEVLLGPDGLLDGLSPGAAWVDMSTSVPEVAERVLALAGPRQVAVLDAPVSGMAAGAKAGRCRSSSAALAPITTASGRCSRRWAIPIGLSMWVETGLVTQSS